MMGRISRDAWAMKMAIVTSERTTCLRRAVGAVLLNARGHVLSTGVNGVAAGMPHCNEVTGWNVNPALRRDDGTIRPAEHWERHSLSAHDHACPGAQAPSGTNLEGCLAIHAEQNALLQCSDVYAIDSVFVTAAPCIHCTKLLMNTSCRRIVFLDDYPHSEAAKDVWERSTVGGGGCHIRSWEKFDSHLLTDLRKNPL